MKKRFLYAILVIVLFIPTFFAIANYHPEQPGVPANTDLVTEISVYDTNGTLYRIADRDADMELFLVLLKDPTATSAVPDPVKEVSSYRVVYRTADGDSTYGFYFSLNPNECYYEDPDGNAFLVRAAHAEKFLSTQYAACVYGDIALPVLHVGGTEISVLPNNFEWQYRLYDGSYRPTNVVTSAETPTVSAPNTLGIKFSDDPDYLFLTVTERSGGEQLYEGMIDSFRKVAVSAPTEVLVTMDARWYSSDSHPNFGSGSYSFYTTIGPDIAFTVSSTTVRQGGALLVSALNAPSADAISFSSEPALNIHPVFYMDGDTARALIPFTYEATAPEYTITFSCGDVTVSETITVQNQTYGTKTYTYTDTLSAANRDNLAAQIKEIVALPSASTYIGKETFVCGTRDALTRTGYGVTLQLSDGTTLPHIGSDQSIALDDWVKAVNDGNVVYVGSNPIFGGIVVVDHGLGVKSWYCRVGRISVKVGDKVEQGQVIARADFSGFGEEKRMHSILSVGDSFISLDVACDGGIRFK